MSRTIESSTPERANAVDLYETQTSGRQRLEEVCAKLGLTWGIVKMQQEANGNGQPAKTTTQVLIGKVYIGAAEGQRLDMMTDECLEDIAAALEGEHASGKRKT